MRKEARMGRKPVREPLSRERVLAAACVLVDREGLEALSMRKLGAALGVEAMSLYNHVADKAALLDGIHETILEEMGEPPRAAGWVEGLRALGRRFRRVLGAHPKALPLFATRPATTPRSMRHVEAALALLREAGFSPDDSLSALQTMVTFVVGHALSQHGWSGVEWSAPPYAGLDPKAFPALTRVAAALEKHSLDAEFEFGLDALLLGLAAKARRQAR